MLSLLQWRKIMKITKYKTMLTEERTCQLVKENSVTYEKHIRLDAPYKVCEMLNSVFQMNRQTEEYVYLICFSTKMQPLGVFEVSHGGVTESYCNSREIFQKAFLCNATSIIVVHNHVSGDTAPSGADRQVYGKIKHAGEIMGIELNDFLIIGDNDFYSFREHGEV